MQTRSCCRLRVFPASPGSRAHSSSHRSGRSASGSCQSTRTFHGNWPAPRLDRRISLRSSTFDQDSARIALYMACHPASRASPTLQRNSAAPSGYCRAFQIPLPIEWAFQIPLPIEWVFRSWLAPEKRCSARDHNPIAVHKQPPGWLEPGDGELRSQSPFPFDGHCASGGRPPVCEIGQDGTCARKARTASMKPA